MNPQLSIIIVSYNVADLIIDCIESIFQYELNMDYEIIVFDNGSKDDTVEQLKNLYSDLQNFTIIKSKENIGFAAGNNRALKQASGDYVVFLNPDTKLIEKNFFLKQILFMDSNPKVGICAPKILYGNKKLQLTCGRKPTLYTTFLEMFLIPKLSQRFLMGYRYVDWDHNYIRQVDWVSGACLFSRKSIVDQINGFDENMAMYAEDVDLCLRTKDLGYTVVFNPNSILIHYEGQSSRKTRNTALIAGYKSKLYFFQKHYGMRDAKRLKILFLLSSVFKIMILLPLSFKNKKYQPVLTSYWIAFRTLFKYDIKKDRLTIKK